MLTGLVQEATIQIRWHDTRKPRERRKLLVYNNHSIYPKVVLEDGRRRRRRTLGCIRFTGPLHRTRVRSKGDSGTGTDTARNGRRWRERVTSLIHDSSFTRHLLMLPSLFYSSYKRVQISNGHFLQASYLLILNEIYCKFSREFATGHPKAFS
ncbi:uncharacterized protein LOC135162179 [Diachasmimorpha longicaudata]|uniref:uncharacterized protein LOC135162179 n=1 Tax=Diachasmimorpha longicaudata TaxID=58733 RepID=UPI0030B8A145